MVRGRIKRTILPPILGVKFLKNPFLVGTSASIGTRSQNIMFLFQYQLFGLCLCVDVSVSQEAILYILIKALQLPTIVICLACSLQYFL